MGALALAALMLASPSPAIGRFLLAKSCSPGMSCYGHVVVLSNGEVVETAAAATAAAVMVAPASDTPKAAEASKAKPDASTKPDSGQSKAPTKTKAEVKAKPVVARQKPCKPLGAQDGPGRFKPYRGPGVWVVCGYMCGNIKRELTFNPGSEVDCWNPVLTYTE